MRVLVELYHEAIQGLLRAVDELHSVHCDKTKSFHRAQLLLPPHNLSATKLKDSCKARVIFKDPREGLAWCIALLGEDRLDGKALAIL